MANKNGLKDRHNWNWSSYYEFSLFAIPIFSTFLIWITFLNRNFNFSDWSIFQLNKIILLFLIVFTVIVTASIVAIVEDNAKYNIWFFSVRNDVKWFLFISLIWCFGYPIYLHIKFKNASYSYLGLAIMVCFTLGSIGGCIATLTEDKLTKEQHNNSEPINLENPNLKKLFNILQAEFDANLSISNNPIKYNSIKHNFATCFSPYFGYINNPVADNFVEIFEAATNDNTTLLEEKKGSFVSHFTNKQEAEAVLMTLTSSLEQCFNNAVGVRE